MSRPSRLLTSWLAIAMLLFAQLAVSAFACEMPATATALQVMDCGDVGMDGAPLCQKHCNPDAQAQAPLAFVASPFVASFVATLPALPPVAFTPGAPRHALLHAISPPIPIGYCRLRD